MGYFDKTYHPPGTPPGTLLTSDSKVPATKTVIRLLNFTDSDIIEKELTTAAESQPYLNKESVTWLHLQGQIRSETIKELGNVFGLHTLALEDVLNKGQRPKVEEYDDQMFIIMSMPGQHNDTATIEQISVFLGHNYVISFHEGSNDPFESLRDRLHKKKGRIRQLKADYLLYCILDIVIDQGYPVLESISEDIESIEDQLLDTSPTQITLGKIHRIRRELLLLRRKLWPHREVLNNLYRNENALISENTLVYLRDCYDHTIQILDLIENYREMAASMIDIYLSSTSHRLNEIMRILTMIATIFIPLTFVVGLYGMNFSHPNSPWAMPELHWYYGYPMVWAIMISIVIGMLIYFKRNKWL